MNWTSNLLIACALKKEAKALGMRIGSDYELISTGLGTDRTLATLEKRFDQELPSLLIFTGMAGQLAADIRLGQFVIPESWGFESGTEFKVDVTVAKSLQAGGMAVGGRGITVRKPVVRKQDRRRLHASTGASICDMESAAAMMISASYRVPCISPKIVSDTSDSGMLAFYRHFERNIEKLSGEISRLIAVLREC